MDAVLRLFQTENSLGDGVELQDRQGEEAERPVRQCPGGMIGAIFSTCEEGPELTLRIDFDAHFADIVDEVREAIGDPSVNRRGVWFGSVF